MNGGVNQERRWTLTLLLGACCAAGLLLGLWVLPLRQQDAVLRGQLTALAVELAPYRAREEALSLAEQVGRAQATEAALQAEMAGLMALRDTFQGASPFEQVLPSAEEGRIDFKVALFNARDVLLSRTRQRNVQIPPGLGMAETIGADELAETRLWQLASIVRLIEQSLEAEIPLIERIEPLPPIAYAGLNAEGLSLREFPIRIVFSGSFLHMLSFLERLMQNEAFFALRRFRVESLITEDALRLRVHAICGAGLLRAAPGPAVVNEPEARGLDEEPGAADDFGEEWRP
ncbi:MAG: hypothetical protein K9N49_09045 [Candidatus Marinimicrobia bacterium]|nr:hypothetical protein [Candidatus Neomarinimicrobiota bacterium]